MIGQVQSFITPRQQAYFISPDTVRHLAPLFDRDADGLLGKDELNISPQALRQIDTNLDRRVQLSELSEALLKNKISVRDIPFALSERLAQNVLGDWVYAAALGSLGSAIDTNADGYVHSRELATALNRGDVILSGSYLLMPNGHDPYPPTTPVPGHPGYPNPDDSYALSQARDYVNSLESNKMRKDQWGNYDPSTGLFTPQEANGKIKAYLEHNLVASREIFLHGKLDLIKGQKMKKDQWGNYDPAVGSLTAQESIQMARKAVEATPHPKDVARSYARQFVAEVAGQKFSKDQWGNDNHDTGLLTDAQANTYLKAFLRDVMVPSQYMTREDKLELIRSQVMQKDQWGNYNPHSGSLTANEAQELSKLLFQAHS